MVSAAALMRQVKQDIVPWAQNRTPSDHRLWSIPEVNGRAEPVDAWSAGRVPSLLARSRR